MNARSALLTASLALSGFSGCAVRAAAPVASASTSVNAAPAPGSLTSGREGQSQGASSSAGGSAIGGALRPFGAMSTPPGGSSAQGLAPFEEDERAVRERSIAQWETEIERQRAGLAASLAQCRDICAAAGNVCIAASEICRLTGDLTRSNARDARCARARNACVDASRRRDGACPVCPTR